MNSVERAKAAADLAVYGRGVAHESHDGTVKHVPLGQATYIERWRNENREAYNAKQREYQKAYRARRSEKK